MSNETGFKIGIILIIVITIFVSLIECTGERVEYMKESVESTEV